MRLSIVTTTLNAMPYVVETTRSILQSPHRDLEYVIIDAGSSDGTLEYIQGLQDSRVRVEVLRGIRPYEAVDHGFRISTGEVLAWLNGDDLYYPWTISQVGQVFAEFPDVDWITGLPSFLNAQGHCAGIGSPSSYPRRYIKNGWFNELAFGNLQQESMFWRRSLYEKADGLNLKYDQAADFDLWTRFARHAPLVAVSTPLAAFRKRGTNRSVIGRSTYLSEIADATAHLPKMSSLKSWLCRHMVTKHALRLLEWHSTPWVYFSVTESRWKYGSQLRPISRESIQQLAWEFGGRSSATLIASKT